MVAPTWPVPRITGIDRSGSASPPTKVAGNHEIGWVRGSRAGGCDSEAAPFTTVLFILPKGATDMRGKKIGSWALLFTLLPVFAALAQDNTSRLIPFSLSTSLPPQTTQEVVVELWDAASGGL